MKLFKNVLNGIKPHFEQGGKLEKLYPAYDAFETFLFVPRKKGHGIFYAYGSFGLWRCRFWQNRM
jgi:Na+-transporting NADH:ubiquinone oxidoreductase subunit NqrB